MVSRRLDCTSPSARHPFKKCRQTDNRTLASLQSVSHMKPNRKHVDIAPDAVPQFWLRHFPQCPPVSHLLKHRLSERWFRIHSLPESKRYAETPEEYAILLDRQNTLLADSIGSGQKCVLLFGDYADATDAHDPAVAAFQPTVVWSVPVASYDPDLEDPGDPALALRISYAPIVFVAGALNTLLLRVADWQLTNFMVVRTDGLRIVAPYDGGVDVIAADTAERDGYKARYRDWLSRTPNGF